MSDGVSIVTRVVFNNFPRVRANMLATAEKATAKAALDMEAGMKTRTPVDTGFLRSSIQARQVGRAHWRVTVGAEYGVYVEYGTRHNRAQPFFFPTIAEVGPVFMSAMRRIAS